MIEPILRRRGVELSVIAGKVTKPLETVVNAEHPPVGHGVRFRVPLDDAVDDNVEPWSESAGGHDGSADARWIELQMRTRPGLEKGRDRKFRRLKLVKQVDVGDHLFCRVWLAV